MSDLVTSLAGLAMPSPVMTAAGCGGRELAAFLDLTEVGAVVTRTLTLDPVAGHPTPRVAETPSGLLSGTGGQNPGLQAFLASELPWFAQMRIRTVVSIRASTLGEYGELARRVGTSPGVSAVEVCLPAGDAYQTGKAVHVVSRDLPRGTPLLAKLSPAADVVDAARAAVENGADAVVLTQGFPGMAIDPESLSPLLGGTVGLLSGPAVHALTLRCVWDVHAALPDVPLVGAGGVRTGTDALAMLAAGASAVQLGTVLLSDPSAPARVTRELDAELDRRGVARAADLVGVAHDRGPAASDAPCPPAVRTGRSGR